MVLVNLDDDLSLDDDDDDDDLGDIVDSAESHHGNQSAIELASYKGGTRGTRQYLGTGAESPASDMDNLIGEEMTLLRL